MIRFVYAVSGLAMGAISGLVVGVAIAILFAPGRNPRQPEAHEWYFVAAAIFAISATAAGAIQGLTLGIFARWTPAIGATIGAVIGTVLGYVLLRNDLHLDEYGGLNFIVVPFFFAFFGSLFGAVAKGG